MYSNILVPIDGSENSYKALDYAAKLANVFESKVTVLSIFRHHSYIEKSLSMVRPQEPENLDSVLSAYAKEVVSKGKEILKEKGVQNIKGFVKMGTAAKKILEFAKEHEIDLIIIGSKGQGELSGYLLGGVSHKVAGLSKCPVLIV